MDHPEKKKHGSVFQMDGDPTDATEKSENDTDREDEDQSETLQKNLQKSVTDSVISQLPPIKVISRADSTSSWQKAQATSFDACVDCTTQSVFISVNLLKRHLGLTKSTSFSQRMSQIDASTLSTTPPETIVPSSYNDGDFREQEQEQSVSASSEKNYATFFKHHRERSIEHTKSEKHFRNRVSIGIMRNLRSSNSPKRAISTSSLQKNIITMFVPTLLCAMKIETTEATTVEDIIEIVSNKDKASVTIPDRFQILLPLLIQNEVLYGIYLEPKRPINYYNIFEFKAPCLIAILKCDVNGFEFVNMIENCRPRLDTHLTTNNQSSHSILDWVLFASARHTHDVKVVRKLIYKGIPHCLRSVIWPILFEIGSPPKENKQIYSEMINRPLQTINESILRRIKNDLNRTFPTTQYFKTPGKDGQLALLNILSAFLCFRGDIGYCQGMNWVAAVLTTALGEQTAFWCFLKLCGEKGFSCFLVDHLPLLKYMVSEFRKLLQTFLPKVYNHLEETGIPIDGFATPWFLTFFSSTFPLDFSYRVFDFFLVDGYPFFLQLAFTLLKHFQLEIFKRGLEDLLPFFQEELPRLVARVDINTSDISPGAYKTIFKEATHFILPKRVIEGVTKELEKRTVF